ncbi:hypothetical protein [Tamlana sp. I1]|uniref:hypothetical protein n=1 Tax=Tamlana sp. I1 TaxID=2762061 RepID=UPI00188FBFA2|nr:hypothetical protein [Tamlana sp. I1]
MKKLTCIIILTSTIYSCFVKKNRNNHNVKSSACNIVKDNKTTLNYDWLFQYKNKTTNSLIWDQRFHRIHKKVVPRESFSYMLGFESTFTHIFNETIGGPPDNIVFNEERNYFVISACRLHSCDEKGFMWFDYNTEKGIVGIVHYFNKKEEYIDYPLLTIASNNFKSKKEIPESAILELKKWLQEKNLKIAPKDWKFHK